MDVEENFSLLPDLDAAKKASKQAEIDFMRILNVRGFSLMPETRKQWWPLNTQKNVN